jgi:hypothetical protein
MRPLRTLLALLTLLAVAAVPAVAVVPAGVDAVAADSPSLVEPLDLDRVFAEPLLSTDYVQLTPDPITGESQYLAGIAELETRYPDVVTVTPIGDLVGAPELNASAGGRPIPVIEVTDTSVPDEDKVDLYISM